MKKSRESLLYARHIILVVFLDYPLPGIDLNLLDSLLQSRRDTRFATARNLDLVDVRVVVHFESDFDWHLTATKIADGLLTSFAPCCSGRYSSALPCVKIGPGTSTLHGFISMDDANNRLDRE